MRKLALFIPVALLSLSGCMKAEMWAPCDSSAADITGTDGVHVLVCRNDRWEPVMTVQEYAQLSRGGRPTIAPLPLAPTTTLTTPTTGSPTTSTSAPTTSTTSTPATTSTTSPTSTTSTTTSTSTTTTTVASSAPVVSFLSPDSGPETGGQQIQITGSGLTGATDVHFGSVPGTDVVVVSDTAITVTTPVLSPGVYPVSVTTPGGTGTTGSSFEWTATPGA